MKLLIPASSIVELQMSEEELDAHWDNIEKVLGPHRIGDNTSDYLAKAWQAKLVTYEIARDLYWASIGLAMTNP